MQRMHPRTLDKNSEPDSLEFFLIATTVVELAKNENNH